jgi:hypothetical protein
MPSKTAEQIPQSERKKRRAHKIDAIASAALVAALIHAACLFFAVGLYANNIGNPTAGYELYRPAFVVDSNLTRTIDTKLAQSCPNANLSLFTMQGDFPIPSTTVELTVKGALLATRTQMFGFVHMNGYYLLFVIFSISFVAQANVLWEYYRMKREKDESFFTEPCAARWFEYALTSPCMITIIAASLLIRDIHTILLLAAAQGALCQFGFGMECAYSLRVCEGSEDIKDDGTHHAIEFRPLPVLPILRTIPKMSQQLWYWSFVPSMLLHVLVWGVLIVSLLDQINTKCFADQPGPPDFIIIILIVQAILFTFFVVVAVTQAWKLDMIPFKQRTPVTQDDVWDSFVDAFWSYTLLSAIAKAMLGITYVSYVNQFPFYTPDLPSPLSVLNAGIAPTIQALS